MNNIKRSSVIVFIIFVAFSVIAFVLPMPKNVVFIISYVFTAFAILSQLYVIKMAFGDGDESIKSKFYGFPIAKVGFIYAIIQIILGIIFILAANVAPIWLAIIIYILLFAIFAVGMVGADAVREVVQQQDIKVEQTTSKIKELLAMSENCQEKTKDQELSKQLDVLSDELRYSDPVSSKALEIVETELEDNLIAIDNAIEANDIKIALEQVSKAIENLKKRNNLCKQNKGH